MTISEAIIFGFGIILGFSMGIVVSGRMWQRLVDARQQNVRDALKVVDEANAAHADTLRKLESANTLLSVTQQARKDDAALINGMALSLQRVHVELMRLRDDLKG